MKSTKTASLEELRRMKDAGELHATRDDASEIDLPDGFWDDAEIVERPKKQSVHLRVEPEVLEFFREGGKGHISRMQAVLKSYVDAQKKRTPSSS